MYLYIYFLFPVGREGGVDLVKRGERERSEVEVKERLLEKTSKKQRPK